MEIYLSRALLDLRVPAARQALSDVHACHQAIMKAYPDGLGAEARARLGVLWREESTGPTSLLIQSKVLPDVDRLVAALGAVDVQVKPIEEHLHRGLESGSRFAFRLLANVTRKVDTRSGADRRRRHGRRVPLRREGDRVAWLARRLELAGAALVEIGGVPDVEIRGAQHRTGRRDGRPITFEGVDFRGALIVRDPSRLLESLAVGIGPAKAYGFGLLTLAPHPRVPRGIT